MAAPDSGNRIGGFLVHQLRLGGVHIGFERLFCRLDLHRAFVLDPDIPVLRFGRLPARFERLSLRIFGLRGPHRSVTGSGIRMTGASDVVDNLQRRAHETVRTDA